LAQKPVILLLDEPFSNLDPDMTGKMREDLHQLLRQTKTTTLLVTHDHDEAFAMSDRIAVLNNGRLEQIDVPEAIYHTPSSPFVADFVGQADFIPGLIENGKVLTEIGVFPNQSCYPGGAKVVVMIRPDDLHVIPNEEAGARILARQFRGSENLYTISLPSGRIVHSSETSTSIYPSGMAVELRIIATHTVLFGQEPDRTSH
jgi:iron(III) transport system ATP-binding protein